MTAQVSDELINECVDVDLSGLYLYSVITGNIQSNYGWGIKYPIQHPPSPPPIPSSTANWRGYIASYRLSRDGRLALVSYYYPAIADTEGIDEQLVGDYWLVMKEDFFGPRVYIPFQNGVIVKDREQWRKEERDHWDVRGSANEIKVSGMPPDR